MPTHEAKTCPRCHQPFECKVGDISQCQCNGLRLTDEERSFIEQRYNDCLCRNCLEALKNKHTLFREKYHL
ncbi:cysteine-rich CWC family protein [Deminuibacter soli]|uniref:Cysteine-rich CWC family protein n=1 Tax=Deminuibacter soli TaxID=2291815 RepID=A0A3E1NF71_9BACT|nr:cysteine-rich CWC family protein [Deminuibacter soli]RFM26609.1 hypothetical protein DXN05_18725 [Deminuibacter soli]